MATQAKPPKFNTDDTPDTPDEIYADVEQGTGLSIEELNAMPLDQAQHEADYKTMNPPTGDWFKEDLWVVTKRVNVEDRMPGDKDKSGRTYYTFSGYPEPRVANGIEYKPMLFLRVSPDRRFKQDKPQEFDMTYKLWARAVELYLSNKGEIARSVGDVCGLLEDDQYTVRSTNGDSGPFIVDIKPVRQRR